MWYYFRKKENYEFRGRANTFRQGGKLMTNVPFCILQDNSCMLFWSLLVHLLRWNTYLYQSIVTTKTKNKTKTNKNKNKDLIKHHYVNESKIWLKVIRPN